MTREEILNQIQQQITANGLRSITGPILNSLLKNITEFIPGEEQLTSSFGGVVPSVPIVVTPGIAKWFFAESGTYPEANNLTISVNKIGVLGYDGSIWSKQEIALPQATQSIIPFSTSTFPLVAPTSPAAPIQRTHENSIWELTNGQTATSTDIPGVSNKWISLGGNLKLDEAGGALAYDTFVEMSSGLGVVVTENLGSSAFDISGEYYGQDGSWGFHPAGIATRTDYIFLQAGRKATIKAVSNNAGAVPLYVVFKANQSDVVTRFFPTAVNVIQTNEYTATEDCYIVANCVSSSLLSGCGISREVETDGTPTVLISDANKNDFIDVDGGFFGYKTADDLLKFENKLVIKNNFNKDFAGMQQYSVLNPTNEIVADPPSTSYALHNYVLGDVVAISLKGRLYDDRASRRGFFGIKADGTYEDIYTVNGITTPWLQIDQTFDVSAYEKISLAIDNSVYVFEGKMYKSSGLQSKTLEDLRGRTLRDRILNGDTPIEVQGLQSQRQEVNLLKFKGKNLFYWSEGWNVSVIKVGDYDIETNTVTNATTIVSKEITGLTSPIYKCPTAFVCNQKVYLVVTAWQPNYCLMYESNDGKNFTLVSNTLANVAGFGGNFGNHWVVPQKIDGYYYWFIEGLTQEFGIWQMKLLKSQSITSGWELVGIINGLSSGTGAKGGPCVYFQDGKFKMIYHYSPVSGSNIPTFIAYAEADINDPLNFTQLYNPLTAIIHKPFGNMTDQYADPELCEIDGRTFLFCSVVDNTTPRSIVYRWECDGRLSDILNSKI